MYKPLYSSLLLAILLGISHKAIGQSASPASHELMERTSLWKQGTNAAGAWLDQPTNRGTLNLFWNNENGSFHRPQEGRRENQFGIRTEGSAVVGKFYTWGSFSYTHEKLRDAGYNAGLINPYRDMPYNIIDENLSDWKKQYYDMAIRVATPKIWNAISFGLDVSYQAHSGAKQRDIRADNRYMTLGLSPGIVYHINNNHHLGLNFVYSALKEESTNSNINNYLSQNYYELNGLGHAEKGVGKGRVTDYKGRNWGAALQYNIRNKNNQLWMSAQYDLHTEEVRNSFTQPKRIGDIRRHKWQANIKAINHSSNKLMHTLHLYYLNSFVEGIEHISQRDNTSEQEGWMSLYSAVRSKYREQELGATYALLTRKPNQEYGWLSEVDIRYLRQNDRYIMPNSKQKHENLRSSLTVKKNIRLPFRKATTLLIATKVNFQKNLSGIYHYKGNYEEYPSVTLLAQGEQNYLTSSYWGISGEVTFAQQIKPTMPFNWFVTCFIDWKRTTDHNLGNRHQLGVRLGCFF